MKQPASGGPAQGRRVLINTGALGLANLWRILVSFATQLLIARRLGLPALGDYTVVIAWLNVGQILCEAGLPALFVRATAGRPTAQLAWHGRVRQVQVVLALAAWLLLVALCAALPPMRARLGLMAAGGALLPFYALYSAGTSLFEATERMERVLLVDALTNGLLLGATIAVLAAGGGVQQILVATVAAQALTALLLVVTLARRLPPTSGEQAPPPLPLLKRALPFFGISLADVLQQRGDLLLLSLVAPPGVAGAYAAANSIVRVAIKLVNAYWRALLPTLSRLHDQAHAALARLDERALHLLALGTLPVAALGSVLAAPLVALLFGAQDPAMLAATATALALLLWSVPLYGWALRASTLFVVAHKPRLSLGLALLHLAALLVCLPPLARALGAAGAAAAAVAGVGAASAGAAWLLRRNRLPLQPGSIARAALAAAGSAALVAATFVLAPAWQQPPAWLLVGAAGLLLYAALAWATGAVGVSDLRALHRTIGSAPAQSAAPEPGLADHDD